MSFRVSFSQPSQVPLKGALVLGAFEDLKFTPAFENWDKKSGGHIGKALTHTKFKGKTGSSAIITAPENFHFSRIVLIGLGKKEDFTAKKAEELGGAIVAALSCTIDSEAVVEFDGISGLKDTELAAHIAFGASLRSWQFLKYFTKKTEDELAHLKKLTVSTSDEKDTQKQFSTLEKILDAVNLVKEVVSEPANVIYPKSLAEIAKTLEKDGVEVEILNQKDMEKLGFGALLGVAQGSANEPRTVVLKWNGGKKGEAPVAFIGKGVTFDSGGISIKPAGGMEDMKWDMAGAAAVMGTLKALAGRKAKVNAVGVMGIVENMPSGTAQRPGDVVKSYSGQTIEVINTDAEGRLVLADVIWYAQEQFKPKAIVDLATLTGAIIISLGHSRAGLFSNNDEMVKTLKAAGDDVGELLWHMPTDDSYYKDIESDIADMKNVGAGREAGSVSAAKFIERYIQNKTPWAHLDIAGTAWAPKDNALNAKGATAFGVRLLNEWVRQNHEEK
ncbi:Cytosol aminopeptidase [Candidatus Bealeia paramacronuclearis]|uniref:Probable cytosol aminopeptidase n=1 Tax=Candidatus Bealeia paramacronuclearis TaxID=1921001 RepID=A0ABZ2C079_9PROT|nr:Cytosol aminopeptidase [Candidatus Bealeia paramacronuclearis]